MLFHRFLFLSGKIRKLLILEDTLNLYRIKLNMYEIQRKKYIYKYPFLFYLSNVRCFAKLKLKVSLKLIIILAA